MNEHEKILKTYDWIKVKRWEEDPDGFIEDEYIRLQRHHEEETAFLIAKVRELVTVQAETADLLDRFAAAAEAKAHEMIGHQNELNLAERRTASSNLTRWYSRAHAYRFAARKIRHPDVIRQVHLDSFVHYETVLRGGRIVLIQYDDDLCPRMPTGNGQYEREPFRPEEGREIDSWSVGEEIEFVMVAHEGILGLTDGVSCADNLPYLIHPVVPARPGLHCVNGHYYWRQVDPDETLESVVARLDAGHTSNEYTITILWPGIPPKMAEDTWGTYGYSLIMAGGHG